MQEFEFIVKRYWEVCDEVKVKAPTFKESIVKAHALPLSQDPEYVPDSMNSDVETDVHKLDEEL